jgi:hypothetical protein
MSLASGYCLGLSGLIRTSSQWPRHWLRVCITCFLLPSPPCLRYVDVSVPPVRGLLGKICKSFGFALHEQAMGQAGAPSDADAGVKALCENGILSCESPRVWLQRLLTGDLVMVMLQVFAKPKLRWLASQLVCATGKAIEDSWASAVQENRWTGDPLAAALSTGVGSKRKRADPLLRMRVMSMETTRHEPDKYVSCNSHVVSRLTQNVGLQVPVHKQWVESMHMRKYFLAVRRCTADEESFAITTDKKRFAGKEWCATACLCAGSGMAFWCAPQAPHHTVLHQPRGQYDMYPYAARFPLVGLGMPKLDTRKGGRKTFGKVNISFVSLRALVPCAASYHK